MYGRPVPIIEVFADAGCPFTHVGLRRLVEHRDRSGRRDVMLRVRAWPLELVNGHPLDPAFIAEEVDEIREQVAPDLFAGFDQAAFPATSIPAMALAIRAHDVSDHVGEQVSLAIRDALFERGLDIADQSVLQTIAEQHGVPAAGDGAPSDEQLVRRDWDEGAGRGVVGSPHFILSAGDFFCPALHIERVDGHLRITADEQAFHDFMEQAFAG
jgi:predicted DsbA family dithiol-disulfide isomerase